ncbi:basic proline-rich protein-like [Balaenoptera ricei]|uniref:basic proline-rich protein-like n=1 Tax=Balaenoptera ricei TaxID=2746895 RepID=UPI0028BD6AF7|nr:basic proline-rich protein-like [Balaenoptera ricei]
MPRAEHAPAGRGRARPGLGRRGVRLEPGCLSGAGVRPRSVQSRTDPGSVRSRRWSGACPAPGSVRSRAGSVRGRPGLRALSGMARRRAAEPAERRLIRRFPSRAARSPTSRPRPRPPSPPPGERTRQAEVGGAWPQHPAPPPEPALLGPRGPPAAWRGGNPGAGPAPPAPSLPPGPEPPAGTGRDWAGRAGPRGDFSLSVSRSSETVGSGGCAPHPTRGGGSCTCAGRGARAGRTRSGDPAPVLSARFSSARRPPIHPGPGRRPKPPAPRPPRIPVAPPPGHGADAAGDRWGRGGTDDAAGPGQPATGSPQKESGPPAKKWDGPAVGKGPLGKSVPA